MSTKILSPSPSPPPRSSWRFGAALSSGVACIALLACNTVDLIQPTEDASTDAEATTDSNGGPSDAAVSCPVASNELEKADLPSGACATTDGCAYAVVEHCAQCPSQDRHHKYTCTCFQGAWDCEVTVQDYDICCPENGVDASN